jgi:hypothetical protein
MYQKEPLTAERAEKTGERRAKKTSKAKGRLKPPFALPITPL